MPRRWLQDSAQGLNGTKIRGSLGCFLARLKVLRNCSRATPRRQLRKRFASPIPVADIPICSLARSALGKRPIETEPSRQGTVTDPEPKKRSHVERPVAGCEPADQGLQEGKTRARRPDGREMGLFGPRAATHVRCGIDFEPPPARLSPVLLRDVTAQCSWMALSQALRARLLSHRPSGTFRTSFSVVHRPRIPLCDLWAMLSSPDGSRT